MKVGFTGTRDGLTSRQIFQLSIALAAFDCTEFHHGDCKGADEEASFLASLTAKVVIHPPSNPVLRAFTDAMDAIMLPSKHYLERNRDIVEATNILFAAPNQRAETLRSGTWSTIRYARAIGRTVVIFYP